MGKTNFAGKLYTGLKGNMGKKKGTAARRGAVFGTVLAALIGINSQSERQFKEFEKHSAALHAAEQNHAVAAMKSQGTLEKLTGLRTVFEKTARKNLADAFDKHWKGYVEKNPEEVEQAAYLLSTIKGNMQPTKEHLDALISGDLRNHVLNKLVDLRMGLGDNPALPLERRQYVQKLGGLAIEFVEHAKIKHELTPTQDEEKTEKALSASKKELDEAAKKLKETRKEYDTLTKHPSFWKSLASFMKYPLVGSLAGAAASSLYTRLTSRRRKPGTSISGLTEDERRDALTEIGNRLGQFGNEKLVAWVIAPGGLRQRFSLPDVSNKPTVERATTPSKPLHEAIPSEHVELKALLDELGVDHEIHVMDSSQEKIDVARKVMEESGLGHDNVHYWVGNVAERLHIPKARAHLIFCHNVLAGMLHGDATATFKRLFKRLEKGGMLSITQNDTHPIGEAELRKIAGDDALIEPIKSVLLITKPNYE